MKYLILAIRNFQKKCKNSFANCKLRITNSNYEYFNKNFEKIKKEKVTNLHFGFMNFFSLNSINFL